VEFNQLEQFVQQFLVLVQFFLFIVFQFLELVIERFFLGWRRSAWQLLSRRN
jgi:hypothetical protein